MVCALLKNPMLSLMMWSWYYILAVLFMFFWHQHEQFQLIALRLRYLVFGCCLLSAASARFMQGSLFGVTDKVHSTSLSLIFIFLTWYTFSNPRQRLMSSFLFYLFPFFCFLLWGCDTLFLSLSCAPCVSKLAGSNFTI